MTTNNDLTPSDIDYQALLAEYPDLMRLSYVAEFLDCCAATARKMTLNGDLTFRKHGRHIRVYKQSLINHLKDTSCPAHANQQGSSGSKETQTGTSETAKLDKKMAAATKFRLSQKRRK